MFRLLTALLLMLIVSGCYTERKAIKHVIKAQAHYPWAVASLCGNFYPPIERIEERTTYKPGIEIRTHDTVTVNCDSAKGLVQVPCPPCKSRVDTFYTDKKTTEVNRAKETALAHEVKTITIKQTKTEAANQWWMWIAIILGIYTLLRWVLAYYTRFKLP